MGEEGLRASRRVKKKNNNKRTIIISSGGVDPGAVQARFLFRGPALNPLRVGIGSPVEIFLTEEKEDTRGGSSQVYAQSCSHPTKVA